MNSNLIKEIIENIMEAADEIKQNGAANDTEYGELLAYAESLSIIKDACAGYNLAELGIDFDIEEKYL